MTYELLDQRKKARLVHLNFISFNMYIYNNTVYLPSSISVYLSYRALIVENCSDITMIFVMCHGCIDQYIDQFL